MSEEKSLIKQTYWNTGLKSFNSGDDAIVAIQKLYRLWLPPFSLSSLATIVGALYADTYWAARKEEGQRMSVTLLAEHLSSAIGVNASDARQAATTAFSQWYGLLVRANFSNGGEIPKSGGSTASPDVLISANNELSLEQLINSWSQSQFGPRPGLKSYAYGRAESVNIGVNITKPKIRMYYTAGGFVPPPSQWQQVRTVKKELLADLYDIHHGQNLPRGTRVANSDAFLPEFSGAGHYCMIATAQTEFFSNRPESLSGNWNSSTWLLYNGAAGWHNIDVKEPDAAVLKFYNQDDVPQRFAFEAHCYRVPSGTKLSIGAGDLLKTVETEITREYQVVTVELEAPANHNGDLEVQFPPLPPEASISFRQLWLVEPKHEHFRAASYAVGAPEALIREEPVRMPLGDFTFVGKTG